MVTPSGSCPAGSQAAAALGAARHGREGPLCFLRAPGDYRATYESCMYNLSTSNDFLLDFHPEMPGVFLATAGSGHGFKFGSVLGRIVLDRLDGIQSDRWTPQFSYEAFLTASSRPRLL